MLRPLLILLPLLFSLCYDTFGPSVAVAQQVPVTPSTSPAGQTALPLSPSPLAATPPPVRPQPLPLNPPAAAVGASAVPSTPYLLVNISWPLPRAPSSASTATATIDPGEIFDFEKGYRDNVFRADLDTALVLSRTDIFGPGCNSTWRARALATFSGDDVFSPGWEAYHVSLSSSLPGANAMPRTIVVAATWFVASPSRVADTPVTILVRAVRENGTVSQTRSVTLFAPHTASRVCAAEEEDDPLDPAAAANVARIVISSSEGVKDAGGMDEDLVFSLEVTDFAPIAQSDEPYDFSAPESDPILSEEPLWSTEAVTSTDPGTSPLKRPVLALTFSWATSIITDVQTAVAVPFRGPDVELSQLFNFGASCRPVEGSVAQPFMWNFRDALKNTGTEKFEIALDTARDVGLFGVSDSDFLELQLHADWWRTYVDVDDGVVNVTASIIDAGGSRTIFGVARLFPGVSWGCPSRRVGTVVVRYDAGIYGVDLVATAAPDEYAFIGPSAEWSEVEPEISPNDEYYERFGPFSSGEYWGPGVFGPLPSVDPKTIVDPEPLTKQGPGVRITFGWATPNINLDTTVRIGSDVTGVACFGTSERARSFIKFDGGSSSTKGQEQYVVLTEFGWSRGMWGDVIEIELFARWWHDDRYASALATLVIERVDETGTLVDGENSKESVVFNPVAERIGYEHLNGESCLSNKVAKIRVSRAVDGQTDSQLFMFARGKMA